MSRYNPPPKQNPNIDLINVDDHGEEIDNPTCDGVPALRTGEPGPASSGSAPQELGLHDRPKGAIGEAQQPGPSQGTSPSPQLLNGEEEADHPASLPPVTSWTDAAAQAINQTHQSCSFDKVDRMCADGSEQRPDDIDPNRLGQRILSLIRGQPVRAEHPMIPQENQLLEEKLPSAQSQPTSRDCLVMTPCKTATALLAHSAPENPNSGAQIDLVTGGHDADAVKPAACVVGTRHHAASATRTERPGTSTQQPTRVKLGDHSVHTTSTTEVVLLKDTTSGCGPADYIRHISSTLVAPTNHVRWHAQTNTYNVGSTLCPAMQGGGFGTTFNVHTPSLFFNRGELPENAHSISIVPRPARQVSKLDEGNLIAYYTGHNLNERSVLAVLQPKLNMANMITGRGIVESLASNLTVHDSSLLYAKLFHYAFVLELFADRDIAAQPTPFDEADIINFINIGDNIDRSGAINDAMNRGDLILVEGVDYILSDLLLYRLITQSGAPFVPQADDMWPAACTTKWPKINVTVICHAVPANPVNQLVNVQDIYRVIRYLASKRCEWDSAQRGIYAALDLVGVSLTQEVGGRLTALRSDLSVEDFFIPRFFDYNFLMRCLNVYPEGRASGSAEIDKWISLRSNTHITLMGIYSATVSAASSTLLYDLGLRTRDIVGYLTANGEVLGPHTRQLISSICINDNSSDYALMLSQPRKAFRIWLGCGIEETVQYHADWIATYGTRNDANNAYVYMRQLSTPNRGDPMCLNSLMNIRPLEWGIPAPTPTANFSHDIQICGPGNRRGWYARLGSTEYNHTVMGSTPYMACHYGSMALNTILQYLAVDVMPIISASTCIWQGTNMIERVTWDLPVGWPGAPLIFNAEGRYIVPFQLTSYDSTDNVVISPVLLTQHYPRAGEITNLVNLDGTVLSGVGIVVGLRHRDNITYTPPAQISFAEINAAIQSNASQLGGMQINPQ